VGQGFRIATLGLVSLTFVTACGDIVANAITRGETGEPATSGGGGSTTADTGGSGGSSGGCPSGSLDFRALLIVKPQADLSGTSSTLSQSEIDSATAGFQTTLADWVAQLTNGRLCFVGDVFVSPRPLNSVSANCTDSAGRTPSAPWIADVIDDIQEQAPRGSYDHVVVYSPNGDPANTLACGDGPFPESNYAGYIYLNPRGAAAWQDRDNGVYDGVLWLWTLVLTNFYQPLSGVEPPPVPDLYNNSDYGYSYGMAPYSGWKTWFAAVLNREVMQNGEPSGLGEPAWAHGSIRSAAPP
jgi:hypothetical protein